MSTGVSGNRGKLGRTLTERHFIGRLSEELSDLVEAQCLEAFMAEGIDIPVKSCSLATAIQAIEPASASELAEALDRSHQLVSQKIPKLLQLGIVEYEKDPRDLRQKLYRLTDRGRDQMRKLDAVSEKLSAAYEDLEEEAGDVLSVLQGALAALKARPLQERFD